MQLLSAELVLGTGWAGRPMLALVGRVGARSSPTCALFGGSLLPWGGRLR